MRKDYRLGIRLSIPFFKNAGVFIVKLDDGSFAKISEAIGVINQGLAMSGNTQYSNLLFIEPRD